MRSLLLITLIGTLASLGSCTNTYNQKSTLHNVTANEKSPEELKGELSEMASNWFYGPGLGKTVANVGTSIIFPPYAFYLLGNAGLEIFGKEPLHVTNALPEEPRKYVLSAYDGITSVPGRITAGVSGYNFYDKDKELNALEQKNYE